MEPIFCPPRRSLSHPLPAAESAQGANQSHCASPRQRNSEQNKTTSNRPPCGAPRLKAAVRKIPFCWPAECGVSEAEAGMAPLPGSVAWRTYVSILLPWSTCAKIFHKRKEKGPQDSGAEGTGHTGRPLSKEPPAAAQTRLVGEGRRGRLSGTWLPLRSPGSCE